MRYLISQKSETALPADPEADGEQSDKQNTPDDEIYAPRALGGFLLKPAARTDILPDKDDLRRNKHAQDI